MNEQAVIPFPKARRSRTPFYATTPLTRQQLAGAIRVAEQQDEAVLAIFRGSQGRALTPSQVWRVGLEGGRNWLLTSVRRSMTNLTDAEVLVRLSTTIPGPYGKPEHQWALPVKGVAA